MQGIWDERSQSRHVTTVGFGYLTVDFQHFIVNLLLNVYCSHLSVLRHLSGCAFLIVEL